MNEISIGIDIGGTFTDFVVFNQITKDISTFKLPSTPQNPEQAVSSGLKQVFTNMQSSPADELGRITVIIHGTTVATNILLERKGVPIALVTTAGFSDIIQIGRQNRSSIYDFFHQPPPPLVPPHLRFEITERIDRDGTVQVPLDMEEVKLLVEKLKLTGVRSIAVCLLFSFLHPEHELILGDKFRQAGFQVSLSSDINPVFREYERMSTTAINAYVSPAMDNYLSRLENSVGEIINRNQIPNVDCTPGLWIMQSNGGSISITEARHEAVRCILSGPAGGVIGSSYLGKHAIQRYKNQIHKINGLNNKLAEGKILTFDMGGTSTDVSIISGQQELTTESIISGCPINLPMLDIHTIGAGGGSIAILDTGGALRVGPDSAGATPGPACYGLGDFATVTDANLILGRISANNFLGGTIPLDFSRAYSVIQKLGKSLGLSTTKTALGILSVANAHMERALRVISVERGHDPRDLVLLSFGGAGGLHTCALAQSLGIYNVLIPPMASTLSAFGMLVADVIKDFSQTVMFLSNKPLKQIDQSLKSLEEQGRNAIANLGFPQNKIMIESYLDMRYHGQSYELSVPYGQDFFNSFHQLHSKYYGYAKPDSLIEIVNLRVRAIGRNTPPPLIVHEFVGEDPSPALLETAHVYFDEHKTITPCYSGELLKTGNIISGPAIIVRTDTTILLHPHAKAHVDMYENLFVEVGE